VSCDPRVLADAPHGKSDVGIHEGRLRVVIDGSSMRFASFRGVILHDLRGGSLARTTRRRVKSHRDAVGFGGTRLRGLDCAEYMRLTAGLKSAERGGSMERRALGLACRERGLSRDEIGRIVRLQSRDFELRTSRHELRGIVAIGPGVVRSMGSLGMRVEGEGDGAEHKKRNEVG
jgi:hypothetical protein